MEIMDVVEIPVDTIPQEPPRPRRGRPPGSKNNTTSTKRRKHRGPTLQESDPAEFDRRVHKLHEFLTLNLTLVSIVLPPQWAYYVPQGDEQNGLLQPLERIYLRHNPDVPEVNPDVEDGLLFAMALGGYLGRIAAGKRAGITGRVERRPNTRSPMSRTRPSNGPDATGAQPNGIYAAGQVPNAEDLLRQLADVTTEDTQPPNRGDTVDA